MPDINPPAPHELARLFALGHRSRRRPGRLHPAGRRHGGPPQRAHRAAVARPRPGPQRRCGSCGASYSATTGWWRRTPKTHAARRVSLDPTTVAAMTAHRVWAVERARVCEHELDRRAFVFSKEIDGAECWYPTRSAGPSPTCAARPRPKVGGEQPIERADATSSASLLRKGLDGKAPNDGLDLADPKVRDYGHPGVARVGNLCKPAGPTRARPALTRVLRPGRGKCRRGDQEGDFARSSQSSTGANRPRLCPDRDSRHRHRLRVKKSVFSSGASRMCVEPGRGSSLPDSGAISALAGEAKSPPNHKPGAEWCTCARADLTRSRQRRRGEARSDRTFQSTPGSGMQ